jgi:hypothetical protein
MMVVLVRLVLGKQLKKNKIILVIYYTLENLKRQKILQKIAII